MPNKTIYVRTNDLDLWNICENKSELLSNALNSRSAITLADIVKPDMTPQAHKVVEKAMRQGFEDQQGFISKSFSARRQK